MDNSVNFAFEYEYHASFEMRKSDRLAQSGMEQQAIYKNIEFRTLQHH